MPSMNAWNVFFTRMPYVYAFHVCPTRMSYTCALYHTHALSTCGIRHTYKTYLCLTCIPPYAQPGTAHTDADTAGSGGMWPRRPASALEELAGLESTLDCCSALAASVREKSVHLLPRMDANVRTGVKTSEAEAGAGGQDQVEELLVYA